MAWRYSMRGDLSAKPPSSTPVYDPIEPQLTLHRRVQRQLLFTSRTAAGEIDNRPQVMRNTLFHNRGDGTFEEIADFSGVSASEWSWQPVFIDVDLDGYEEHSDADTPEKSAIS